MPDATENAQLKPLANVITLGVSDLERQRAFYRDLGWPQIVVDDDFAAFELQGSVLALFATEKLAADGRAAPEAGTGGIRFTIGVVVDSAEEVDRIADRFRGACAGSRRNPWTQSSSTAGPLTSATRRPTSSRSCGPGRTTPSWRPPAAPRA
jgi:hypothetical protein